MLLRKWIVLTEPEDSEIIVPGESEKSHDLSGIGGSPAVSDLLATRYRKYHMTVGVGR